MIAAPEGFNPWDQSASRRERLLLAMNTRHCHGLCVFQPYKLDEKPVTPTSRGVWLSVEAVRNLPGKPFESLLSGTSIVGQFGTGTVLPSHKLAQVCLGPPLVLLSFYNNTKKKTRLKTLTSLFSPLFPGKSVLLLSGRFLAGQKIPWGTIAAENHRAPSGDLAWDGKSHKPLLLNGAESSERSNF